MFSFQNIQDCIVLHKLRNIKLLRFIRSILPYVLAYMLVLDWLGPAWTNYRRRKTLLVHVRHKRKAILL
jgi:hypothetical protein